MSKLIWTGLEDSGKTLCMATMAGNILYRNAKWLKEQKRFAKKHGVQAFKEKYKRDEIIPRPIIYNCPFSNVFLDEARALSIPTRKWKDLEELPSLNGADLFIDEVGTYFDSRTYSMLPLDIRLWLAQASKLGVDIFGAAQDFAQVDISFRRLTTHLYLVTKLAGSMRPHPTRPPVKRIWGICTVREMDPINYDTSEGQNNPKGWPWPFFIRRSACELFDTTKRIEKSAPPPYKHVPRRCEEPNCKFEQFHFEHGVKHKVTHL